MKLNDITVYGWWITDTGEILEVDYQNHYGIAQAHLICQSNDAIDVALNKGWLRLYNYASHAKLVMFCIKFPNIEQIKSLNSLDSEYHFIEYNIECLGYIDGIQKHFQTTQVILKQALNKLRAFLQDNPKLVWQYPPLTIK